jgi:hypothetical protein
LLCAHRVDSRGGFSLDSRDEVGHNHLADDLLCLPIENVHIVHIEQYLHLVVHVDASARVNPRDVAVVPSGQVHDDFVTHQLGYIDGCLYRLGYDPGWGKFRIEDILGPYTKDDRLANIRRIDAGAVFGNLNGEGPPSMKRLPSP